MKNRQRGIIAITTYIAIGMVAVIGALSLALRVQTNRLATSKAETVAVQGKFDLFVEKTKQFGEAQNAKTKALDAANKQLQEKANADSVKANNDLAKLYADYKRLRNQRSNPSGSGVSQAPTFTASADKSCFDSRKFVAAMGTLEDGVLSIVERGDSALTGLSSAMKWASELKQ